MTEITRQKFWKNFTQLNWEKTPMVFKNFQSSVSDISQDQIFSILINYSDLCRKNKSANGFKLFIDGQQQYENEILQILPIKKDKNFQGYHRRMAEIFSDYCLVCDELLQTSENLWQKLTEFTNNLFSHVGQPNRFVEMGLYIGNYRKTPFGVHVDGCGVFSFPVVGKKIFRLWSPEFAKKNPALDRSLNYSKFKKNSEILNTSVGDMAYWPSSAWHIAESDGSFNATWSLGVWVDQPFQQTFNDCLQPLLKLKLSSTANNTVTVFSENEKNGQILKLPKNYLAAVSALKKISDDELYDSLMRNWILHQSKQGFKTMPRLTSSSQKITFQSQLQIRNGQNILWAQLKSKNLYVYGFRGVVADSNSIHLLKLIQNLNLGRTCLISEYLRGVHKHSDLKILNSFIKTGWH